MEKRKKEKETSMARNNKLKNTPFTNVIIAMETNERDRDI